MKDIVIPDELGGSWSAFCAGWCPEGSIAYSPEQIATGLAAVKRLWPEKFAETIGHGRGGTWAPTVLVDTGLLLIACENAQHFIPLLARLRSGQRAAYSELVVGASIARLGWAVRFEGGPGQPDVRSCVDNIEIAFEVYAPNPSQSSVDQGHLADALQRAVLSACSNCRVEIGILDAFSTSDIPDAIETIKGAVSSNWTFIGSWAHMRRVDEGERLPPTFDGVGMQFRAAGDSEVKGPGTSVVIRWEPTDERAELALQSKRAQVREGIANVVVVDVCATGGVSDWPEEIASLSGADYAKIGAAVFFEQGSVGPPEAIRRRWRVVENSRAAIPILAQVLAGFESLDESKYQNRAPSGRLSMG